MNQAKQARQLARIPRIHLAIEQINKRNPDDKRLSGLKTELERRMLEVKAFSMTPAGEGFEEAVAKAVTAAFQEE